jgi:hypothetical protein
LEEWLLQKTEDDIEKRFRAIATRRAADGVGLHQFVWVLIISRNHLWQFLRREAFADNAVELFGELELQQMLNHFFDRAVYYGIRGYDEAAQRGIHRRYGGGAKLTLSILRKSYASTQVVARAGTASPSLIHIQTSVFRFCM